MQVVCISRGTFAGGRQLAEKLAAHLGYDCMSREELTDSATHAGIPVGQLEMAVVRQRPLSPQMAIHKERFKAWVTATLCERALAKGLVYHGRTGHLQLPGISDVLRVRTIMDAEMRIGLTMTRLGLSYDKAKKYVEQVDEDRHRWARTMYNLNWEDPAHYDVLVNLSHMKWDNAASALVAMAQLPDFNPTPATTRKLQDLHLAARCRLAVGEDPRTARMDVAVKAEAGSVLVTYLPREQGGAEVLAEVLRGVEGVVEVVCTMATTRVLWIQERFDPKAASLNHVVDIAGRWNAAVELVQLKSKADGSEVITSETTTAAATPSDFSKETGGILDDEDASEEPATADEGIRETIGQLVSAGRAGGFKTVFGGGKELVNGIDRTAPYSLVVVGDVFLDKGESVRKRLAQDLTSYLSESLRTPVIGSDELTARYLFGPKQWVKLIGFAAFVVVLLGAVFANQEPLLEFLRKPGTTSGILRAAGLFLFVPVFAFAYGSFSQYLLRLFRFE